MSFDNINEYYITKQILWKYNKIWKKFSYRKWIGDCSFLYKKFRPVSYEDFYQKYVKDGENNKVDDIRFRGRTEKEIYQIALQYRSLCDINIDIDIYVKNIILHTIIETYNGQKIEETIQEYIESKGYNVIRCCGDEDAEYGIDLKVHNDTETFALQIKPLSFFKGNKNISLINDRISAFVKEQKCYNTFNIKTYYIVYDIISTNQFKILKNKNKILFKLKHLCHTNGIVDECIENCYDKEVFTF